MKSDVQICNKSFATVVARVKIVKMARGCVACFLLVMSTKKEKLCFLAFQLFVQLVEK